MSITSAEKSSSCISGKRSATGWTEYSFAGVSSRFKVARISMFTQVSFPLKVFVSMCLSADDPWHPARRYYFFRARLLGGFLAVEVVLERRVRSR